VAPGILPAHKGIYNRVVCLIVYYFRLYLFCASDYLSLSVLLCFLIFSIPWCNNATFRCADPFVYPGARTVPPDAHKRTAEEKHLLSCSAPPPREHQKFFEVPVTNARKVHLQSYEAATSGTTLRGRMFHKNTRARTRSLSPGPRGHDFASSFASPRDVGVSSRSVVKRMDDLNSRSQPFFASSLSQPLPRPPAHIASCLIPSSPIASAQSQSQWKKGKALGSGTFGQVYVGFNRYECPYVSFKLKFHSGSSLHVIFVLVPEDIYILETQTHFS
jgi:mitogen-activated protein kinase kinase kinase 3